MVEVARIKPDPLFCLQSFQANLFHIITTIKDFKFNLQFKVTERTFQWASPLSLFVLVINLSSNQWAGFTA